LNVEKAVRWVPISGLSGENIITRVGAKCPWYKGGSLMEVLDELPIPKRDANAPLRLPIMDKYKESGFFVFGKVESGTLVLGHTFAIVPSGDEV